MSGSKGGNSQGHEFDSLPDFNENMPEFPDGNFFETPPEPTKHGAHQSHAVAGGGFEDIDETNMHHDDDQANHPDHGNGHEDGHPYGTSSHDYEGPHGEGTMEQGTDGDQEIAEGTSRSFVSRFKFAILGGVAALGLGGAYMTGMFNDQSTAPHPVQQAVVVPKGPNVPVMPGVAPVQQSTAGQVQQAAVLPSLPQDSMNRQEAPIRGQPGPASLTVVSDPGLADAMSRLAEETRALNGTLENRLVTVDKKIGDIRDGIVSRMDRSDGQVADLGTKVSGMEQRLSAIEAARGVRNGTAPAQVANVTPQSARPHAEPTRTIAGYALRGVSQGESPRNAYVETPSGSFLVSLGQVLPGAGTIREIRKEAGSWIILASEGTIRP